jgi:beta-glucosidase
MTKLLLVLLSITLTQTAAPTRTLAADPDFLWGVANAAFQVEGSPAPSDWNQWAHTKGKIKDGTNADVATDFWNRYDEDFSLAQGLSANAFRMSIAWERIEPAENQWDEEAFQHYTLILQDMKAHGLEPVVTIFHNTLPLWLSKRGGVLAKNFDQIFANYAFEVVKRLSASPTDVHYWLTLNEPVTLAEGRYIDGTDPPGNHVRPFKFLHAIQAQIRAHIAAVAKIRALNNPDIKIGVASDWNDFEIQGHGPFAELIHFFSNRVYNQYFLDGIIYGRTSLCFTHGLFCHNYKLPDGKPTVDFIGVNYYTREQIRGEWKPPFVQISVGISAQGMSDTLNQASMYHLPLMVTENGVADPDDSIRPDFIRTHIAALDETRATLSVPVLGYLHWSLTDNFEWSDGLSTKYGLVDIDYDTLKRTPKPSYEVYRDVILQHLFNN